MNPTPEQLARAAELAPKVAELAGLDTSCFIGMEPLYGTSHFWLEPSAPSFEHGEWTPPLDPRAFQAVLLALDLDGRKKWPHYLEEALDLAWAAEDCPLMMWAWLLTPSGMLAFYEALVDADPIT